PGRSSPCSRRRRSPTARSRRAASTSVATASSHNDAMFTRRNFLKSAAVAGAGLMLAGHEMRPVQAQATLLERNKAVALRFKKAQGTPEEEAAMKEVLAPGYKRLRGGLHHLAANAQGQDFPGTGSFLRGAFPDRVDMNEEVIAEGDQV